MSNNAFASFFIDLQFIVNAKAIKKIYEDFETLTKKLDKITDDRSRKEIESIDKIHTKFKLLSHSVLSMSGKMSIFAGTMATLTMLKFNNIKDLKDNIDAVGKDSKLIYDYLNASTKTLGTSARGVMDELNEIMTAQREFRLTGQNSKGYFSMFGASIDENIDIILEKFRNKLLNLPNSTRKAFAEKMGLEQISKVAELSNEQFEQFRQIQSYNKNNIDRLAQSAAQIKQVMGTLGNTKDAMIIKFSPFVDNFFRSFNEVLESKTFEILINSFADLADDIVAFDKTLKGVPIKTLISLIGIKTALDHKLLFATVFGASIIQDVIHGLNPNSKKKSVTGSVIRQLQADDRKRTLQNIRGDIMEPDDSPFDTFTSIGGKFASSLVGNSEPFYNKEKAQELQRAVYNDNKTNNTNNNINITNNITVNSTDNRQVAEEVARAIENNTRYNFNNNDRK